MIEWLCTALGIKPGAFVSGLAGGVFSLYWVPQCHWKGIMTTIFFAGVTANYATTPIHEFFAIKGLHEGGIGVLIGLFSMSIAAAMFKTFQDMDLWPLLRGFIQRLYGGGGQT